MDRFTEAYNRVYELMNILNDCNFNIDDPWSIECIDLPFNIHYDMGATRLVVWDEDNRDYVAKIALSNDDEKYCVHEVELYNAAEKAGLAAHFGWCAEIYCYGNKSVYAMEFLDCNYEKFDTLTYEWGYENYCEEEQLDSTLESSRREFSNCYWGSELQYNIVLDWFEEQLSKNIVGLFDNFINSHGIDDIHPGNVSFRGTVPVLCDYAGYGW